MADNRDDLASKGAENQIEGTADQVKGRVRNAIGGLTGNDSQQLKGKAEELKGKVQKSFGEGQSDAAREP
jgi:uncharacterized protein YjbJ (UPF0337 family)